MEKRVTRIAIVDDDAVVLRLVAGLLRAAGYEVATYSGTFERLNFIADSEPDLVLLDVNMPFLPGHEVLRLMKDNARLRDIPVVLLSANGEAALRRLVADVGANGYLLKSDIGADFARRIELLLGERRSVADAAPAPESLRRPQ